MLFWDNKEKHEKHEQPKLHKQPLPRTLPRIPASFEAGMGRPGAWKRPFLWYSTEVGRLPPPPQLELWGKMHQVGTVVDHRGPASTETAFSYLVLSSRNTLTLGISRSPTFFMI